MHQTQVMTEQRANLPVLLPSYTNNCFFHHSFFYALSLLIHQTQCLLLSTGILLLCCLPIPIILLADHFRSTPCSILYTSNLSIMTEHLHCPCSAAAFLNQYAAFLLALRPFHSHTSEPNLFLSIGDPPALLPAYTNTTALLSFTICSKPGSFSITF